MRELSSLSSLVSSGAHAFQSPMHRSLEGRVAWVIGGASVVGTGLVRGLLRAGATVMCNSRHKRRLTALTRELSHPERLITLQGSMLPERAEATFAAAMERTSGRLDHVVAHSAVRWWTGGEALQAGLLTLEPDDYAREATQLPMMQFNAARLLVPKLAQASNPSYTFITGSGEGALSPIEQANTQAVSGLAAALRQEHSRASCLRVCEVRVGLEFNRDVEERRASPREYPLSHDIGRISAGLAASVGSGSGMGSSLHLIDTQEDITALKRDLPVLDAPYPMYYSPRDIV